MLELSGVQGCRDGAMVEYKSDGNTLLQAELNCLGYAFARTPEGSLQDDGKFLLRCGGAVLSSLFS